MRIHFTQTKAKIKSQKGQSLKSQAGQAAAEMAILGTLILICFSVLLTYAQRLDSQQQIKMETFRKALQKAYERNSSVSYTLRKDVRSFNLASNFGEGQASALSSTASVMWQKGAAGDQGSTDQHAFSFYEINDRTVGNPATGLPRQTKTIIDHTGARQDTKSPVSVWNEQVEKKTDYDNIARKKEEDATGTITNTQISDLEEKVTTRVYTRFDDYMTDLRQRFNPPNYVNYHQDGPYRQGVYYDADTNRLKYSQSHVGTTVHKERTWRTED